MLISHRGNDNHNYRENTIDSIVFSLNKNYIDGVEFDVQITKDNVIVLNHDFKYENNVIKDTNYNLLKLDKLEDLLNRLDTKKLLLIEIKSKEFKYKSYNTSFLCIYCILIILIFYMLVKHKSN